MYKRIAFLDGQPIHLEFSADRSTEEPIMGTGTGTGIGMQQNQNEARIKFLDRNFIFF